LFGCSVCCAADSTTLSTPRSATHSYLVKPPDTHRAHRWVRSILTDSGIQSQMALRGKSPHWHTGWRHRRAQLQNQNMSGAMPTELEHASPSPPDPEFTGVQPTVQGSEERPQPGSPRDSIPTYPARSSCPSSHLGRRRAQVSAEDTPPQPDATAEMAVLSCHPPQALERLAGKPQGGVWCGMARPGWRTCPWGSRGLGSKLALVFPGE
jgi:hypothetical protein